MSSPAARSKQRRYRHRLACGMAVLKVEAPLFPLVEALLAAGMLTEAEALDRRAVERQAGAILDEWRKQWAAAC